MQILSNNAVATGVGVYWMFYSGASFEDVEAPEGLPGLQAHDSIEGLRYASNKNRMKILNKIRQKTFSAPSEAHFPVTFSLTPACKHFTTPVLSTSMLKHEFCSEWSVM